MPNQEDDPVRSFSRRGRTIYRLQSEPPGRGAAWTEERGTSDEGRRHLKAPRQASGEQSPLELLLARGRARSTLAMLGPAFVAAIAYVDPGNFATNIQGGAQFGYLLLWVVMLANLMAMLVQY